MIIPTPFLVLVQIQYHRKFNTQNELMGNIETYDYYDIINTQSQTVSVLLCIGMVLASNLFTLLTKVINN